MRARTSVLLAGLAVVMAAPLAAADPTPGVLIIDTIAGNGTNGFSGDGGPATEAALSSGAVAVDPTGNVYLQQHGQAGTSGDTIRKIDTKGVISTLAGAGDKPPTKEGVPAAESDIYGSNELATDKSGNLYIVSRDPKDEQARLYQVSKADQLIRVFAGGGATEPADGTPATDAKLASLHDVWVDAADDIYLASNDRVLRIDHATKLITVVAGPDEGVTDVENLAVDKAGNIYLTQFPSGPLFEVSKADRKLKAVACGGKDAVKDGVPALQAECRAGNLAVDAAGSVYFTIIGADGYDIGWVLTIDGDGKIRTVVGTGKTGFGGDGGKASEAMLHDPRALRFDAAGNLYIADLQNRRIRKVSKVAAPVAADDSLTVEVGKDGSGDVLANDKGSKLTVTKHTDPKSGALTIGTDGKFTYKPNAGFAGDDSFNYTVTDSLGQEASAKVSVTVTAGPVPQGSSGGGLASTGASVVGLTAAAIGLLGLGGGLLFAVRRRRRHA